MGKLLRFPRRGKKKDLKARPLFPGLFGTDARPMSFASDASAAAVGSRAATDEELARKLRIRRNVAIAALSAIFISGSLTFVFAERGYLDNRRQREELARQTAAVEAHQERVQGLKRDAERLKTEASASERIAREDLGYAEKGEIVLLLPDDLDATTRSAIVPSASSVPTPAP